MIKFLYRLFSCFRIRTFTTNQLSFLVLLFRYLALIVIENLCRCDLNLSNSSIIEHKYLSPLTAESFFPFLVWEVTGVRVRAMDLTILPCCLLFQLHHFRFMDSTYVNSSLAKQLWFSPLLMFFLCFIYFFPLD